MTNSSRGDSAVFEGIRAVGHFLHMLEEAARGCGLAVASDLSDVGIGLRLDRRAWVGIRFDAPDYICFEAESPKASRRVVNLTNDQVSFFTRSAGGQLTWLEDFLRECFERTDTSHSLPSKTESSEQGF
jgi:hypothetical protein